MSLEGQHLGRHLDRHPGRGVVHPRHAEPLERGLGLAPERGALGRRQHACDLVAARGLPLSHGAPRASPERRVDRALVEARRLERGLDARARLAVEPPLGGERRLQRLLGRLPLGGGPTLQRRRGDGLGPRGRVGRGTRGPEPLAVEVALGQKGVGGRAPFGAQPVEPRARLRGRVGAERHHVPAAHGREALDRADLRAVALHRLARLLERAVGLELDERLLRQRSGRGQHGQRTCGRQRRRDGDGPHRPLDPCTPSPTGLAASLARVRRAVHPPRRGRPVAWRD